MDNWNCNNAVGFKNDRWLKMKNLTLTLLLLLVGFQPLAAQEIGVPVTVDIPETSRTLALDFSNCDYELVLFSTQTDAESSGRGLLYPFGYSVTVDFGASSPLTDRSPEASPPASLPERASLESVLRARENELATRLQESGGYRTHAAKAVPQKIGSTRQFVYPSFDNVPKTTITASLVASGERANVYVDLDDLNRLSRDSLQAQVDRFSEKTYPIATSAFGKTSDVDNDGKILILYTNLVNPDESIFGAAGFFYAPSLLSIEQGGDGNLSDMFYLDPDIDPSRIDAVLAHEFQHLINFNQHVLIHNGTSEDVWLNEGLSHICEDLIGANGVHNIWNVDVFLRHTAKGPLGIKTYGGGNAIRGALYLFVRSLVEEFGSGVLARLAQTGKAGFTNVEGATGRRFADIFDRHVSRLFLSGLGLNTRLNYSTPPLTDKISHTRAFPLPRQALIWPGGAHRLDGRGFEAVRGDATGAVTLKGELYQLSPVYIRLIGNRKPTTITVQTVPDVRFRAQLIPIPVNYLPSISIPSDYRVRFDFDVPLPVQFRTGEAIPVSGTVSDTSLTGTVEFLFTNGLREIDFRAPITKGEFSKTLFFYPDEVGRYTLSVWERWRGAVVFNSIAVVQGQPPSPDFNQDGTVDLTDFTMFAQAFNKSWADEDFKPWFDLDLDGEVGFSDFLIFGQAFGTNIGS